MVYLKYRCFVKIKGDGQMKRNKKYSKGITIVSLVITIILLLILAGISIQAFTGSGLFAQAIKSKQQAKLAEIEEHLKLTLTEMITQKNGEKVTIDEYIKYLKEIENINITDEYEENGKYIIEVDDKYVFEISDKDTYISIDKEGLKEDLAPKIVLESITNTTNSISVQVSTKRNEGGKIEYYIKAEDEEEYTLKEKTKDTNYTYTGLTQNKKYNVKIVAVTKNKLTAEILVDRTLESVPDLIEGDVTFTYSVDGQEIDEITWTNKAVTVTASTTIKGYRLQTSKDGKNWSNEASQTYTENGYIYAVLYDGTNYGSSTSGHILNIDTQKPVANISSTTTNSITFTGTDTASTIKNENASGIAGYIVQESSTAPSADDSRWTSYNGTSKTVSGLTQGKTYYVFVKDKAGNVSAAASKGTGTVTNLTSANITFTYSPSSWTNGSVKVTAALKDMTSSYTLKITDSNPVGASKSTALGWADASTGITVGSNKTVYAVLIDNEGQIGAAASGSVEKIDTVAPTIGSATGTTATGNTGTITVSSVADTGGSGLKGYYISTSSTTPTATSVTWTSNTASSFTKTVSSNGTYYVWVIDNAGNVSSSKSCSVSGIVSKASITTYSGITIVAGNTGTPTLTYTGSPKSITYSSSNTGVATINSSTGVVTGVSEGTATMTVTLTNYDGTTVSKTCIVTVNYTSLASKVTVGDYVAYDATSNYSYTSVTGTGPSHGSGYSSSQTFTTNSDIKWRVLSANTSTGEVVLISETPIKTDAGNAFIMSSAIGYLYAEEELNRICAIYGHGTGANTSKTFTCQNGDTVEGLRTVTLTGSGARSINVDDINAITGYTPTTGSSYTKSIYYPTKTTSTGYSGPANRTDTNTDYYYKGSSYLTSTEEPYKMLFRDTSDSSNIFYLLASRCVTSFSSDSWFNVRCVGSGGVHYFILGYGFGGRFGEESFGHGVRPIVYLKSTIQTSGKDSSGAWTIIDK